jgi:hypothetical protein
MEQAEQREVCSSSMADVEDPLCRNSHPVSQQPEAVPLETPRSMVAARNGFAASHPSHARGPPHVHGRRGVPFPTLDSETVPPVPPLGSRGRSPSIPAKASNITLGMEGVRIN